MISIINDDIETSLSSTEGPFEDSETSEYINKSKKVVLDTFKDSGNDIEIIIREITAEKFELVLEWQVFYLLYASRYPLALA